MAYYARDIEQPMYEDWFRKLSVTMALSLGDQTFFSGIDKVFDAMNGNEAAMKSWFAKSIPIVPSAIKTFAKSIDGAYKDIYNDYTDYEQSGIPLASMALEDEITPLTGKPIGVVDNKIASFLMAYSPIKLYAETDNTEAGKAMENMLNANYEGMPEFERDSTGKIKWEPEDQQWLNRHVGQSQPPPYKDINKVFAKPKHKYTLGKIRAMKASGIESRWDKMEFKEELIELYDDLDAVWRPRYLAAEQALFLAKPELRESIYNQKALEKHIKHGRIDEAVRTGNKDQQMQNLLQMAK